MPNTEKKPVAPKHDVGVPLRLKLAEIYVPDTNYRKDLALTDKDAGGLLESVRQTGVIEPILVIRGTYPGGLEWAVGAGFRRYAAAKIAAGEGWANAEIPAYGFTVDERKALRLALIENEQRTDVNPLNRAAGFQNYMAKTQCSAAELAEEIGRTEGHVSQVLAVGSLPDSVKKGLKKSSKGDGMSFTDARVLAKLNDLPEALNRVYTKVEENGLGGRALLIAVDDEIAKAKAKVEAKAKADAEPKTARAKSPKAKGEDGAEDEEVVDDTPTMVRQLATAKLSLKKVSDARDLMVEYAWKYERATKPENKQKYEHMLEGMRLMAGVEMV